MDSAQPELLPAATAKLLERTLHPRFRGFAVIDLETTGLCPQTDRILEVGAVLLSPSFQIETRWSQMVNPGLGRDVGPTEIHRIHAEDVRDSPTFGQLSGLLSALLRDRIAICHNSRFDIEFLQEAFATEGRSVGQIPALCTLSFAKDMIQTPSRALTACCDFAGITLKHHHRALHDAEATAQLAATYLALAASDCELPAGASEIADSVDFSARTRPSTEASSEKTLKHFQGRLPSGWAQILADNSPKLA